MAPLVPFLPSTCRLFLVAACVLLGVVQCFQVVYVDQSLYAQLNTTNPSLSSVQQIAVDSAGAVYVADLNNYRVVKLSVNSGAQLAVYSTASAGVAPVGLTVSSDNTLWVTAAGSYQIVQLNSQGNVTNTIPVRGRFVLATAVAVDNAGRLYYIDDTDTVVVQIDIASSNITGTLNTSLPYLNSPAALAVDSSGNVHVAYSSLTGDPRSASVLTYSPAGTVLSMYSYYNYTTSGYGAQPVCLAIDAYGNLFMGDTRNNAVYKMDASGNLLALYNSSSRATMFNPRGCAVDNAGHLFISTVQNVVLVTTSLNPVSNGVVAPVSGLTPLALILALVIVSLIVEIALV